jgi:hypothetical protein
VWTKLQTLPLGRSLRNCLPQCEGELNAAISLLKAQLTLLVRSGSPSMAMTCFEVGGWTPLGRELRAIVGKWRAPMRL